MTYRQDDVDDPLIAALLYNGFCSIDQFGEFVTYERVTDSLKIHVGPDGSFSALDGDDEVFAEGKGAQDLFSILVTNEPRRQRG